MTVERVEKFRNMMRASVAEATSDFQVHTRWCYWVAFFDGALSASMAGAGDVCAELKAAQAEVTGLVERRRKQLKGLVS